MLQLADRFTRHRHHPQTTGPPWTHPLHCQHKSALPPDLPHPTSYHLDLRLLAHPRDCPVLHHHAPHQAFASKSSPPHSTADSASPGALLKHSFILKVAVLVAKDFQIAAPHSSSWMCKIVKLNLNTYFNAMLHFTTANWIISVDTF